MILRYAHLVTHPKVFLSVTGLHVAEFDDLATDLTQAQVLAEYKRLRADRPSR